MEEKSDCEHCRTWEEEMYWKCFNSIHFFQILPKTFHDHLVLPEKFAAHMTTELPDRVSLRGPSGIYWDIELQKTNSLLFFGDGWKNFVKTYDLEENCLLMFKYKRNLGFEVLIFDQKNLCEREATYFVKKCSHSKPEHREVKKCKKRVVREGPSSDLMEDDTEDNSSALFMSKKSKKNVEEELVCLGRENDIENPGNQTSNAAASGRGRLRKMVAPCNSPSESNSESKEMSARNETTQNQGPISMRYMTTPENEDSSPKENRAEKSRDILVENPSGINTAQKVTPISRRVWSNYEDQEDSLEMNHSDKFNSISGKELSENGNARNLSQISGRELIFVDNKKEFREGNHSKKPRSKNGRQIRQATPKSSRKRVSRSAGNSLTKEYMSNRRAVTEMEKEDALRRAKEEQTEDSFIVVMRPTCVYKRFYMSIPADWMNRHLLRHNQDFILRVGEKSWHTMFYYNQKRGGGGLSSGWKKFALENSLEESDVLLFKFAKQNNDDAAIAFDVEIFRVIQEILPLRMGSPSLT